MYKQFAITTFAIALLTGCQGPVRTTLHEVTAGRHFSVTVPVGMTPTEGLHDIAQLQYVDDLNGYYLIGLEESKQDLEDMQLYYTLEDYAWFVERTIMKSLDTANLSTRGQTVVGILPAEQFDLFGTTTVAKAPVEIWYHVSVIESPTHFYQLIAWTARDRHLAYKPIVMDIVCSFKEIESEEVITDQSQPAGSEALAGEE